MVAFPGFECISEQPPITFQNRAGHTAIITVRRVDGNPPPTLAKEAASAAALEVEDILEKIRTQHGARAVMEKFESRGEVVKFASRVDPISFSGAKYFLLYAAVAPEGHLALLTVEGSGTSSQMAERFDPHWKALLFAP